MRDPGSATLAIPGRLSYLRGLSTERRKRNFRLRSALEARRTLYADRLAPLTPRRNERVGDLHRQPVRWSHTARGRSRTIPSFPTHLLHACRTKAVEQQSIIFVSSFLLRCFFLFLFCSCPLILRSPRIHNQSPGYLLSFEGHRATRFRAARPTWM
jgi:hypothetical protein